MKKMIRHAIVWASILLLTSIIIFGCDAKLTSPSEDDVVTNIDVEKVEDGKIKISWNYTVTTDDTLEYWIARKIGDEQDWFYLGVNDHETKFYFDSINTNDSLVYAYKVAIYNATLEAQHPFSDVAVYMSEFTSPTNVETEQIEQNTVKINWHDRCVGEEGYYIDRKEGEGNWQNKLVTLSANSTNYTDSTSLYQTFSYRVRPYYGTTTPVGTTSSITPILPAPSDLQLEQVAIDQVQLTWTDNSEGEMGFGIDKKVAENEWQTDYGFVEGDITTWIDEDAEVWESILYRVYAVFAENQYSDYVESETIAPIFPAPSNLSVSKLTEDIFRLSWDDHTEGEEGFELQRKIGGLDWNDVSPWDETLFNDLETIEDVTHVDDDLSLLYFQAADVSYRVRAFKGDDYSEWSEIAESKIRTNMVGEFSTGDTVKDLSIERDIPQHFYRAYLANNYDGVKIIDISNPNSPSELASINLPDRTNGVYVKGDYLYALYQDGGFIVYNIEDLSAPVEYASVILPGVLNSIYVHTIESYANFGYAFVASGLEGIRIIDFTAGNPNLSQTITGIDAKRIYVPTAGDYAYVAVGSSGGFRVVDLSNEGNYSIDYSYTTGNGSAQDVFVEGNYAYLANGNSGLEIVDVTNLSSPQKIGEIATTGFMNRLVVANDTVFVLDSSFGLYIINVADKTQPFIQGSYAMNENFTALDISGSYLYVSYGNDVIVIQIFEEKEGKNELL
jgi:hypothetical protein